MGRCGCAEFCGCVMRVDAPITLTGEGTTSSPWTISVDLPYATCDDVMGCVGPRMGSGLVYNAVDRRVTVSYSADPANVAGPGSDGGIFVPSAEAPGQVAVVVANTQTVNLSGEGTAAAPITAVVNPGSVAITSADSPSVDLSGAGTAADPLTAEVRAQAFPTIQSGQVNGGPNNTTGVLVTVTFPRPFTAQPQMATNIFSGAGASTGAISRAIQITPTSFGFFVTSDSAQTWQASLQWIATLPAVAPLLRATRVDAEEGWSFMTGVCRNPGCPRDGVEVPWISVPDNPAEWGWSGVVCGTCGQPITDLV